MRIFFPMTCNIITPGHIKCLKFLNTKGEVVIGLLTKKGLAGYKKEMMLWKDRKYILENVKIKAKIIPQNSLNPISDIKKYKCNAIASGDGFEKVELQAVNELGLKIINIKLKGEKEKKYSSSKIK